VPSTSATDAGPKRTASGRHGGSGKAFGRTWSKVYGMDMDTEVTDIVGLFGLGYRIITNWELP